MAVQCGAQTNITASNKDEAAAVTKELIQLGDDQVYHLSEMDPQGVHRFSQSPSVTESSLTVKGLFGQRFDRQECEHDLTYFQAHGVRLP